ncbi:MAG TPA: hypothetical protein VNX25_02180, partial [Verrucomicrobiae bacterium]|nr:hypothetical protein [Verrucomicrobiae bacterium]
GHDPRFERSLRMIRVSLLAEHAGLFRPSQRRCLREPEGLVARLDRLTADPQVRLRVHTLDTLFDRNEWLAPLQDQPLELDPESPLVEEAIFEVVSQQTLVQFAEGIGELQVWLGEKSGNQAGVLSLGQATVGQGAGFPWKALAVFVLIALLLLLFLGLRAAAAVLC